MNIMLNNDFGGTGNSNTHQKKTINLHVLPANNCFTIPEAKANNKQKFSISPLPHLGSRGFDLGNGIC